MMPDRLKEVPTDLKASLGLVRVLDDAPNATTDTSDDTEFFFVEKPDLGDDELLAIYRHMLRVRLLDERMMKRQRQGKIGFYGAITGQEATPIAAGFALEKQDWVFPALRENAIMLVRGFSLKKWLAQVYGNSLDVLKGRQMPSHMSGREVNQVAWSSCLGPQLPQAVGAAWAAKIKGHKDVVTMGFIGDGATSEPDFHCAMNFAGVYRPPCVLICQNNHWAISVPSSKQTKSETFAVKAHAYGVPGIRVDGNDVLALYRVIKDAVDRARSGGGPTFIEALTYRIGAHSSSDDPTVYRSEDEVERWRKKDPLMRFEALLRSEGLIADNDEEALRAELDEEILTAVRSVEGAPAPKRETLFEDVFRTLPWHLEEQKADLLNHPPAPSHD